MIKICCETPVDWTQYFATSDDFLQCMGKPRERVLHIFYYCWQNMLEELQFKRATTIEWIYIIICTQLGTKQYVF